MPCAEISVNQLVNLFSRNSNEPTMINTSLGNVMIEIQGDLVYPTTKMDSTIDVDERFIEEEGKELVRFGILSYDPESKNVTLFIGKKQRLLGTMEKLEPPLGILRFNKCDETVMLHDIIRYKILFKNRPLPIM